MKNKAYLILTLIFLLNLSVFSWETVDSLKDKVSKSSLVVVGTITSIKLGEITISSEMGNIGRTQRVELKLKISEYIYGKSDSEVTITCQSFSFTEEEPRRNGRSVTTTVSSAGFSSSGISIGKIYIAYLKDNDGKYSLSIGSNQYLEEIDDSNNNVKDIGQTSAMVDLDTKLETLRKLAKEKMKDGKVSQEARNNQTESKIGEY